MIWPMRARSLLLGKKGGGPEAHDRDVRPVADEVEDDEALFCISELMILFDYEQLLTGNKILQAK